MTRWAGILFLVFVLTISPTAAQDTSVADYVPADFAGFIRINTADPERTAAVLDVMAQVGSLIQPARFQYQDTLTLGDFVPVVDRFSQENATCADLILPWLRGELVIAYRQFDAELNVQPDDVLVIASAAGLFGPASSLSSVITGRHLTRKETFYPDVTIYTDDRVTLALTADAVLIGSETLVDSALAVRAGESPSLTGQAAYQAVHSALVDDPLVFAYAAGEHALDALSGLVSGNAIARPLFPAFGEALTALDDMDSFGTRLLSGQMDGIGVNLDIEPPSESPILTATLAAHSSKAAAPESASVALNPALLDFVPRSALLVHTGTDIRQGMYTILGAMPLANFAGQILGGVPVVTLGDAGNLITAPSSDDIQSAVESFLAALSTVGEFDLNADLLDHLSGNYVVALLPRPKDPIPVLNAPYELLLTADVKNGDAALAGVAKLMQAL
ncbi:MAG: hypothetical protein K8I60_03600, partial [Anaerolineae bacterium]|nr:hypothetical protein [Anaerolineae bacterium]